MAAKFTLVLHNGVVVEFYSGSVDITADPETGRVTKIKVAAKRRSQSLVYVNPKEIDAIIRDTSDSESEAADEEAE